MRPPSVDAGALRENIDALKAPLSTSRSAFYYVAARAAGQVGSGLRGVRVDQVFDWPVVVAFAAACAALVASPGEATCGASLGRVVFWSFCSAAACQGFVRYVQYGAWPSPGFPTTLPVLGNAVVAAPAFMRFLLREAKRREGLFLFWPGGVRPILVVANPAAAKAVLGSASNFPKGEDYRDKFGLVFGDGLVTSSGDKHARARKVLGKYFLKQRLEAKAPQIEALFDATADELWEPLIEKEAFADVDVQEFFHLVTLQAGQEKGGNIPTSKARISVGVHSFWLVLGTSDHFSEQSRSLDVVSGGTQTLKRRCITLFPRRLQAFCATMLSEDILGWTLEGHEARGDVAHYVAREVSFGSNVVGEHMLYNIPMSPLLPRVRRLAESCAAVRSQVFLPLLRRRRAAMDEGTAPDDCLTALLAAQEGFSDDELMDQLVTLIGAGHDTSAYFCCYAALLLAKHPTWQRRLRDELRGDDLDWQASLLKRVVMEVLRLFPVIPMVTRTCARATDLPDDTGETKRVPRGARLLVPFFLLNRLPSIYGQNAADFDPDRWLDHQSAHRSDGVMVAKKGFLPFGYGSRTCIGYSLALLEMRVFFKRLLDRYDLDDVPGFAPTIKAGVSLTVENPKGIKVRFRRRAPPS